MNTCPRCHDMGEEGTMTNTHKVASILDRIAERHEVTVEQLKGRGHIREVRIARAEAMQELYRLGLTMREVGVVLNRHISTVFQCLRKPWTP